MQQNVDFTVRLKGESASVLNKLVNQGYCGSKTEAVRTALISYALKLGVISPNELFRKTAERVSKKGYTDDEIKAQIASIRSK
ncbi:MAG: hypothetical protein V1722_02610 [Candidatus Micrarchaeota archaeon]